MRAGLLVVLCLIAGCAPMQMQGVNMLQSSNVALDDLQNVQNMQHLKELGANTIALVPFIRQSSKSSCELAVDSDYSDVRLRATIRHARMAGLKVLLKPQILIPGSWAGEIDPESEKGWECWFSAYRGILLNYAKIANETGVETLVVGTELVKTELRFEWKTLLTELRKVYSGKLSYVGNNLSGAQRFSAFDQLDSIAISFYPGLEDAKSKQQVQTWMQEMAENMKLAVKKIGKPFWFAEVGITSRAGALEKPWLWGDELTSQRIPDVALQADVLDGWLTALKGNWHQGILIWNWFSDPKAGGADDVDFTIQNKPATNKVSCHWLGACK